MRVTENAADPLRVAAHVTSVLSQLGVLYSIRGSLAPSGQLAATTSPSASHAGSAIVAASAGDCTPFRKKSCDEQMLFRRRDGERS